MEKCLGFAPDHVVLKTLTATTQLVPTVEAETREIMRDHFQTWLPELKVRRVHDICYVDTFFSSLPSARGYTCWNLFCFRRTGLDVAYLMRRRSQSPTTLPRMIAECGAPTVIKSDNAPEFKGKRWMDYLSSICVRSEFTEAHHPNKNLAERRGGALKAATTHLLTITRCPPQYWCFALEYVCLLRTVLARRSLDWSTPHETHWGERPDISMFRFTFWQPVWYYHPRQSFPRTKMMKGRFLGVAQNIGDAFCFLVLTQPEGDDDSAPQVLARSVIRKRYPREESPVVDDMSLPTPLTFYRSDGITPLNDPNSDVVSDGDDQLTDIIAGTSSDLQSLLIAPDLHGDEVRDELDDGIFEVYGPPTKRPRTSIRDSPSSRPPDHPACLSQQRRHDSEEASVLRFEHVDPTLSPAREILLSNVSNETSCVGVNLLPEPTMA
jgi:hypothetical protein